MQTQKQTQTTSNGSHGRPLFSDSKATKELIAALTGSVIPAEDDQHFSNGANVEAVRLVAGDDVDRLVIPQGMSLETAKEYIAEQEEEATSFLEQTFVIDSFHPVDALICLTQIIHEISDGWPRAKSHEVDMGFFGKFTIPKSPITVKTGPGEDEAQTVLLAKFEPTVLEGGHIFPQLCRSGHLHVEVRTRQNRSGFAQLLEREVKKRLRTGSIYKGKAIELTYGGEESDELKAHEPTFMDISGITRADLVVPSYIDAALDVEIFSRIQMPDMLAEMGVKFGHGVLLSGPYGTGKSMTGEIIAAEAVRNGVTFISCTAENLVRAYRDASRLAPAVVFVEDIDRAARSDAKEAHGRSDALNELVNTLDSAGTKANDDVMVVFTTNHKESIHPVFLRAGGRTDAIIEMPRPDAEVASRLVRRYCVDKNGNSLLADMSDEELVDACRGFDGMTPAFISEGCQKAKVRAGMRRRMQTATDGEETTGLGQVLVITADDIRQVAEAIRSHFELVEALHRSETVSSAMPAMMQMLLAKMMASGGGVVVDI